MLTEMSSSVLKLGFTVTACIKVKVAADFDASLPPVGHTDKYTAPAWTHSSNQRIEQQLDG